MSFISKNIPRLLLRQFQPLFGAPKPFPALNYCTSNGHEKSSSQREKEQKVETIEEVKQKILDASLKFVPQYGWTSKTLAAGAESLGYATTAHGLFPEGGAELVHYFYHSCNQQLEQKLKEEVEKETKKKVSQFTRDAVETRLRMIIPYVEQWPQAMGIMALPRQAPRALCNLADLVDTIWHYAGDKSTNMNWYTKRIMLAGVYKSTELCLIQDKSEDFSQTWKFLDRRMSNVASVGSCLSQAQEFSQITCNLMGIGLKTGKNMLGLNRLRI